MTRCRPSDPKRSRQRGGAAIELGVLATVLITIVLGVSQLGRAMYQYDTLVKSARVGARYLSQVQPGDTAAIAKAKCLVVYGVATPCSGTPQVPGLTLGMVSVCDAASAGCSGYAQVDTTRGKVNLVEVKITGASFQVATLVLSKSYPFGTITATMTQGSI